MPKNDVGAPRTRDGSRFLSSRSGRFCLSVFLCLFLSSNVLQNLIGVQASVNAHAAAAQNPNPPLPTPSWLNSSQTAAKVPDPGVYVHVPPSATQQRISSPASAVTPPVTLSLTPQAQTVTTQDGHLTLDVPAGTVSAAQVKAAGGQVFLKVTQTEGGSGGSASGHIILGSYQLQVLNAQHQPISSVVLAHPLTLSYRLGSNQTSLIWQGQKVYATWQTPTAMSSHAKVNAANAARQPLTMKVAIKQAETTPVWSVQTWLTEGNQGSVAQSVPSSSVKSAVTPAVAAASSSTVTFSTQAPEASWGQAQSVDIGLSSGSYNYTYPITVLPGPGGFAPKLNLTYSSGSVNESHNIQATAPWVGEGWNLSLGSITWSQENVTPGDTNNEENVWTITDSNGISGQLIPPDINLTTTAATDSSTNYIWHSAPESHAKIQEVDFNKQPCWHVWLPSGVMEEFGCTKESRQSATDASGNMSPYRWDLDLMVDRFGNQIRVHYQQNKPGASIRDSVISSIEYDDPSCHQTTFNGPTAACSTWNPKEVIYFNAMTAIAANHLTNSAGCQNWSSNQPGRCDDPVDLSGSGGLQAPTAFNTYVLNNIQIQSAGNIVHEYDFFYDQGPPQTILDPLSGLNESAAGYLNLTRIEEQGTGNTPLNAPVTTMTYTQQTEHFVSSDDNHPAQPSTNCLSWIPRYASGCWLWEQTHNDYYLNTIDNGRGWHETLNWGEAHNNTHTIDASMGATTNAFTCNGNNTTTTNACGEADDRAWSRIVLASRRESTNGVTSNWSYKYYVNTLTAKLCNDCTEGYLWGNSNDNDYADYYNGQFTSFSHVVVVNPDQSSQQDDFYSTGGWGIATSNISCFWPKDAACGVDPYWYADPGLAGKLKQELNFESDGRLLSASTWNYLTNCPPAGVPHSTGAGGAPNDVGDIMLSSELDRNNPVVVCDPQVTQEDNYLVDGAAGPDNYQTNGSVPHKTIKYSYDGDDQGSAHANGYDYGNVSKTDVTANDVGGQHFIAGSTYYPNDNLGGGIYLTSLPAYSYVEDGNNTYYACQGMVYGANSGPNQVPSLPDATQNLSYLTYSSGSKCSGSAITVKHGYDGSGNAVTGLDGDGHQGCTSGSAQYSACATYDAFGSHMLTAANAKNQTVSQTYSTTAAGGYGQWVVSTKDANGQTTSYQYDVLGRLAAVAKPGDTLSSPTISSTYKNSCSSGSTDPCIELDTTTRLVSGGTQTVTTQQFYDGQGRLIETKQPGPNLLSRVPKIPTTLISYTIYDSMGRPVTQSQTYAVSALTGTGYITPDLTQPRTQTKYDGLGRSLGTATYQDQNTIVLTKSQTYTVQQGLSSFNVDTTTPFELVTTLDGYNHRAISYSDALGRHRYDQIFNGTGTSSNPYTVVRTIQYNRDTVGNVTSTITFDNTGARAASQSATYDGVGRKVGMSDSDAGSGWTFAYDNDSNLLSQKDPRGTTTYLSYDALDRPLCKGTSSNPCGSGVSATFFYDSYNNSSNAGETFPASCVAPSGSSGSYPIGGMTAETFSGKAGSGARCYGYDQRGQLNLSGLEVNADGQDLTQTMNFAYNDAGQITGLVYPDGEAVTSQYDNNGYFRSAYFGTATNTDPVTFLVGQTSYTNQGQLSSLALGGSAAKTGTPSAVVNTAFTYDGIQRPLSSSASTSAGTIWSQARTYDNVGNVLSVNTTLPTTTGGSQSEMQSFCYDALNRLVWAGDTGTPTGGDHCGLNPTGTTISTYQQSFSYDALDRLTNGPSGKETYGTFPTHGANTLGSVPNQYASYDAMGNMTCRNVDTTSAHSCDSSQTGALMTYDNEGRLETWTAPSGTTANAQYLYDTAGNRVFAHTSSTVGGTATTVDTMTFDGYTDVTTTNGTVSTTKYYMAGGQRVALKKDGVLSYLLPDLLGSTNIALNSDGSVQAVQLFSPFGSTRYSDGTMPTPYNFTGQRLDSLTGLLYYNARYYDPASGRFISADSVIDNSSGNDPYAYVTGNPETFTDPTGHYEPRGLDGGDESTIGFGPGAFDNGDSFGNDEGGSGGSSGDFNLDGSGGGSSGDFNSDGGSGGGSSGDFNSPGGDSNNGGTGSSGGGDAQNGTSGNSGDAQNGTSGNSGDAQSVSVGNGTSNSATEDTNSNVNEQTNVQQIQKIRADNNVGARRNIATINYSIGGESDQAWASSGPDFNGSVPKPTNPVFDNTPTANGNLRDADSEFKLLNYIAQRFNPSNAFTSDIGGSAELYTELPPCLSCSNVIGQFRSMFPNIDLTVIYGPANTIWWGP